MHPIGNRSLLFGKRYQFPFVESADKWGLHEIKEANEESEDELSEWFEDCHHKKPLLLYAIYKLKTLPRSMDDNLRRLMGRH